MRFLSRVPLALVAVTAACARPEPADLVLRNGTVYTANDAEPTAQAVAIRADRIVYVGSDGGVARFQGPDTRVVDLEGATVLPGLTDAHVHLTGVGRREITLNLEDVRSLAQLQERVAERVGSTPAGRWVTGRGWIEREWTPQVFPTRQDLDQVSPNHPVILTRADGHGSVVNSAALRAAGITRRTPNPFGGEISKDARGDPNGMLIDAAQGLVRRQVPAEDPAQTDSAVVLGARRYTEYGWTQVHDAGVGWDDVERYRRLYQDGRVKLRIYAAIRGPGRNADTLIARGASVGEAGGRLTVRTIKVSIDGALGSRGAALLAPYSDMPGSTGLITQREEELRPLLTGALGKGIQVEIHAIGDRANRLVLDLYEEAFKAVPESARGVADPRWRVEHAQIVHLDDIPRFAALKVLPSMQPSHAIGDLLFAPARLGSERLAGAYWWKSLIESGVVVPGGSDAPVERGDPMIEFYAAVGRKGLQGQTGEGWHPEQAISRDQALKMFTLWPAYAAFEEGSRGTIEVGKLADFTILDKNIMTIPVDEILSAKAVMTVINGEIVHDRRGGDHTQH